MRINNVLSTVSLCRRAGRLVIGFDAVIGELSSKNFGGVILALDVSEKTEKEVRFHAARTGKEVIKADFSMDDVKNLIGKRAGVLLVTDEGLYGSVRKHINMN